MHDQLLNNIFNMLGVLAIVAIIAVIWFLIWTTLRIPIKMKDEIFKEREQAQYDLLEIQAAKGVEWENYKELQEEIDKLRKAYFKEKETTDKLKEEKAKLLVDKENLSKYNQELKKAKTAKNEQ